MADLMAVTSFNHWIGGVFALSQTIFQEVVRSSTGQTVALLIVLVAGLSLAVGQSIILFINRVSPFRFFFSLLLNAILFTCGFLFLVLSTWALGWLPGFVLVPWRSLLTVWGLSYAPLLFSFLGALPYAGVPILNVLSVWRLLAMIVGFSAIAQVSGTTAFAHVAVGWFILQLLEGSVGQPIARFGQRLAERVAGVDLADNASELAAIVESGLEQLSSVLTSGVAVEAGFQNLSLQPAIAENPLRSVNSLGTAVSPSFRRPSQRLRARFRYGWQGVPQAIRLSLIFLGMVLLFIIVALLLNPIRSSVFIWHDNLPRWGRWFFDLVWIGIVAIVFAGLLAPLEALGWWAGWYGDAMKTIQPRATESAAWDDDDRAVTRYVIYLDGVGQSGEEYTPDVAAFIQALQAALPEDIVFVQGLMLYSVFNRSLDEDRPLAWLWHWADRMRWKNPAALLGIFLNLRNMLIVGVSADRRYGPIYNQGIAQTLYNGLLQRGYQPGSGIPVTMIGYSGGGEMSVATAPYLRRVLSTEIEVISLGGVMSANNNFLKLEHLYHLVGDRDRVAGLAPFLFPGRTKLFPLSYWNRALRKGKITRVSLGSMEHQVPGGMMDPNAFLPNGESHLQHTIAIILSILDGRFLVPAPSRSRPISNYEYYQQADFNHYGYYPLNQTVNSQLYQPIATWMGRLILPQHSERRQVRGVWFEVHHAEVGYESWVGQTVMLRWLNDPSVKQQVRAVTRDVHFSADAEYSSQYGGSIHPDRLDHWQQVGPLESLAGAHPQDDIVVMLNGRVQVETGDRPILRIGQQPVEVTGRYYGLVQFIAPVMTPVITSTSPDRFQVRHFNAAAQQFDGETTIVSLPQVLLAKAYGSYPSTTRALEQSPLNEAGWYIYGAPDRTGMFVVRSLAPRSLLRLQPDRVVFGSRAAYRYIRQEAWARPVAQKGQISSVLCAGDRQDEDIQAAIDQWKEGDRALLLHVYGGIGGKRKEPAAATPLFFGHFAYGVATVIRDPLSRDLRFEILYHQVYSQNTDGLTAGTHHWSRYMGDRQWGWLGNRPVCDILVRFVPFTGAFNIDSERRSPLTNMLNQLQVMTARYRIGDGTGATYVGPANNCAQDSNQALFASIRSLERAMFDRRSVLSTWQTEDPMQAQRYQQLLELKAQLRRQLQPLGAPRADWEANEFNLGTTLEDDPLHNLWAGIGSWRTILPRKASDAIVHVFLKEGATVWVLRTTQVGGYDPDIEPIAPMTI